MIEISLYYDWKAFICWELKDIKEENFQTSCYTYHTNY